MLPNGTWLDASGLFNLSTPSAGGNASSSVLSAFPYCAAGATDYVFDANATRAYANNTCIPYLSPVEVVSQGPRFVWLYTYWREAFYERPCADARSAPKFVVPAAPNSSSPPRPDFRDPGFVPNCGDVGSAVPVARASVLPVAPEEASLTIRASYVTTWGRTRQSASMAVTISPGPAAFPLAGYSSLSFPIGSPITLSFKTLLGIAGIDLDSPNALTDGGQGPPNVTSWPSYRVTGVRLIADLVFGDFVENATTPDPFNFADSLSIRVYPAARGTFVGPEAVLFYNGRLALLNVTPRGTCGGSATAPPCTPNAASSFAYPESLLLARSPQGVQVVFVGGGVVGRPSAVVLLESLVALILLGVVARILVDIAAGFLIEGFKAQKYQDDGELRVRQARTRAQRRRRCRRRRASRAARLVAERRCVVLTLPSPSLRSCCATSCAPPPRPPRWTRSRRTWWSASATTRSRRRGARSCARRRARRTQSWAKRMQRRWPPRAAPPSTTPTPGGGAARASGWRARAACCGARALSPRRAHWVFPPPRARSPATALPAPAALARWPPPCPAWRR